MIVTVGDSGITLRVKPIYLDGSLIRPVQNATIFWTMRGSSTVTEKPMTIVSGEPSYYLQYVFGEADFATAGTMTVNVRITKQNNSVPTSIDPFLIFINN